MIEDCEQEEVAGILVSHCIRIVLKASVLRSQPRGKSAAVLSGQRHLTVYLNLYSLTKGQRLSCQQYTLP